MYAVNCIALDLTPDCWYYVREELALFHAVLYLVALDHNMKYGIIDSPTSLYHGREAFRLINEALQDGTIRDTLIAAVSLIVSREVRYPLLSHTSQLLNGPPCRILLANLTKPESI